MLNEVRMIQLPKFIDDRGNLTFIECEKQVPFKMKRVYMIYDVPGGEMRGGHSYRTQQELIIALSGSFDLVLDDGMDSKVYSLNRSYNSVFVPAGIWRKMQNFSTNSLCLVLASTAYDESDYMRDYELFIKEKFHGCKSIGI